MADSDTTRCNHANKRWCATCGWQWSEAEFIVQQIFELNAQYQGDIIKAANRETFMREHLYPLVQRHLDANYARI